MMTRPTWTASTLNDLLDDASTPTDCDRIWLTDRLSVRAELSGCADWFTTPDAYNAACDRVWQAAELVPGGTTGFRISRERAAALLASAAATA